MPSCRQLLSISLTIAAMFLGAAFSGAASEPIVTDVSGGDVVLPEEAADDGGERSAAATTAPSYSMKIVVTMPTGSEGVKLASTQPSNTKLTPCVSTTLVDAVTFTLTYNAGITNSGTTPNMMDVYMMLFNAQADGVTIPRYYVVKKQTFPSTAVVISARNDVADLNAHKASDIYVAKASNQGGSMTETFLNGQIILTGATITGTWQLVGIVADSTNVDFDDPSTWKAWDVGTFMIRKPWSGPTGSTTNVCL